MDKIAKESLLYDYYGKLLTEKKRMVMEYYHEDDMSLSEIADELGVTRAAVYDALKNAEKTLDRYEEKLGLVKANREKAKLADKAEGLLDGIGDEETRAELKEIIDKLASQD